MNREAYLKRIYHSLIRVPWIRDIAVKIIKQKYSFPTLEQFELHGDGSQFYHLIGLFHDTDLNKRICHMPIKQGIYLYNLIRREKPKRIMEIGRFTGGSTVLFGFAAKQYGGAVYSIDNGSDLLLWDYWKSDKIFMNFKGKHKLPIFPFFGDSNSFQLNLPIDMIYIDGDHSYDGVRADFYHYEQWFTDDTIMLFDDYRDDAGYPCKTHGVYRFVHELLGSFNYKLIHTCGRMAHIQRWH